MVATEHPEEPNMTKTIHGKVQGRTIELDEDLGVPDGEEVEIIVRLSRPRPRWGEGILRSAGALADDPHWDAIMEDIQQDRRIDRAPQAEDL